MASFPVWWPEEIQEAQPAEGSGIWGSLKSTLDIQQYIPRQADGIICKEMTDRSGHHFMLKNGRTHSYDRLSPEEYWVWQKLDGETTVQGLVLAYFLQYQSFAFAGILTLLERLRRRNMLSEPRRDLYGDVSAELQKQGFLHKLAWVAREAFTREFAIKGLDRHLARLHRRGGWILFTWPVQVLFLLVSIIGTYLFFRLAADPNYQLLSWDSAVQLGLLSYVPAVIHEFGHAITAKHHGCDVHRGGVMLYYGLPAAFVETTDIWMFAKRARLAVTWAGPYTGYILGGACSLIVYFFPGLPASTSTLLLQIALAAFFGNTFNLLPILKLDGYYLVADALEIPRLRERSMEFITRQLVEKIKTRAKWTRDERIFLVFGALAFLSTFYFTYTGIQFWDKQASRSISQLLNLQGDTLAYLGNGFIILLAASSVFLGFTLLVRAAGRLMGWLRRKGIFANRLRAALAILAGALALAFLPRLFFPTLAGWVVLIGGIAAFVFAAWMAASIFIKMHGSVHARMWLLSSLGLLAGAAGFIGKFDSDLLSLAFGLHTAGILLSLLSFLLAGRLLRGLRGSWREVSLVLVALGVAVWVASLGTIFEVRVFAGLLIAGGLIHWFMRPSTRVEAQVSEKAASTRGQMMASFNQIRKTILAELELDFGKQTRQWVEDGKYRVEKQGVGSVEFSSTMTGVTPLDYGGALALSLEELLSSVERAAGKKYAWRTLAFGYDKMDWERQEIIEDYFLKYVGRAAGLSNQLQKPGNDLHELVRSLPMSLTMTDKEVATLCRRLRSRRVGGGEVLLRRGEQKEEFCIIRMGSVEMVGDVEQARGLLPVRDDIAAMQKDSSMILTGRNRLVAKLGRGDYYGDQTLLTGKGSSVLVRTVTPVEILTLGRHDFDQLVRRFIQSEQQDQKISNHLRLLRHSPLFSQFEGFDLKFLATKLEPVAVNEGQTIFRQGDQGDSFYIIETGKVSVQIESTERTTLGVGEYFGEIALIMNIPRTATIVATQPTTLLKLKAEDFAEMLENSSVMRQAVERVSSRRVLSDERSMREAVPL